MGGEGIAPTPPVHLIREPIPSGVPTAENSTAQQRRRPVHVFVGMAIFLLLTALIREIDWPHRGAIHVQFEDIGASVMPARIELPT